MQRSLSLLGAAGMLLALVSAGLAGPSQPPNEPDPKLTPGATLPVTKADVCVPGYSKKVRNVPEDVKKQVYAEYGIKSHAPGEYEVDHLISLELGGSNSIKNLWPQSYKTQPWNAHVKDKLENELHAQVCSGKIDLQTAQTAIAQDWIAAYKKYFHANGPKSRGGLLSGVMGRLHGKSGAKTPTATTSRGKSSGKVWVNTKSGKYFKPDQHYYGKTKEGKYMTEAEALKAGYQAAKGP